MDETKTLIEKNDMQSTQSPTVIPTLELMPTSEPAMYKVYYIPMDYLDNFWKVVEQGARDAAQKAPKIEYRYLPLYSKSLEEQAEMINKAVYDGADVILVAPNGYDMTTFALMRAKTAGVKIIYIDTQDSVDSSKTITTDNWNLGNVAGKEMLATLYEGGCTSGMIGIISVNADTKVTVDRDNGFREVFKDTEFEILSTLYCEGDPDRAHSIADELIERGVVGIFGTNEGSAVGSGNAINADGNKVVGIGCDQSYVATGVQSDRLHGLLQDGALVCTIVQKPYNMGYLAMETAIDILNGIIMEDGDVIDPGVTVLTKNDV